MSRTPSNKNLVQATLHHYGSKKLGPDATNVLPDGRVRKEGLKHLGRRAGAVVAAGGLAVGGALLLGNAIDRSPTVRYQDRLEQEEAQRQAEAEKRLEQQTPSADAPEVGTVSDPAVGPAHDSQGELEQVLPNDL